jgi:hypothetical protein
MGESPDTKNPLVNFALGEEIWQKVNQLNCGSSSTGGIAKDVLIFPNPAKRGTSINIKDGMLTDFMGRQFALENGHIPVSLAAGIYQLNAGGRNQKLVILD